MLRRLLDELAKQRSDGTFTFSVVVADNDDQKSAQSTVADFSLKSQVPVVYCCEPRQNIALTRNKALEHAKGDYIAFLDDDEFPAPDWLPRMLQACHKHDSAGVLGPVRPHFEEPPPGWVIKGGFCDRPEHPTGRIMQWTECRTGNVLFRRLLLDTVTPPFDPKFGTGGEDMDFFRRLTDAGFVFVWCNEAVAYETVPPARLTRTYMLKRALLRGKNILKHSSGPARFIATSLVAAPLYVCVLPFTILFGHHQFMKYAIKLCDHGGRLLALARLNPIDKRA